jgi:hypothetical protein
MIIGKPVCYFCKEKGGLLHSVNAFGIYGEIGKRIYYHPDCLELVEMEPEKFGHKMVDKALHIHELMDENKKVNKVIIEKRKEKIEKLRQYNFERMIPDKN